MRSTAFLGLIVVATCAVGTPACFPDYSIASGGSGGGAGTGGGAGDAGSGGAAGASTGGTGGAAGDAGSGGNSDEVVTIQVPSSVFAIRARDVTSGGPVLDGTVRLTHAFEVDVFEVTVARFREWNRQRPCAEETCTLDPGGPYDSSMHWDSGWNMYLEPHGLTIAECYSPYQPGERTTWEVANQDDRPDLPMTCVNWYEAVAFCASEGKRLLTHAEWIHVATSGNPLQSFPWGTHPAEDCDDAIWHLDDGFCDFPTDVGSADGDQTDDGVYDMAGSVFEWVWDAPWTAAPTANVNFVGPEAVPGGPRSRKGGAYIVPLDQSDLRLQNDTFESYLPDELFSDAGFRCARTVLP